MHWCPIETMQAMLAIAAIRQFVMAFGLWRAGRRR